MLETLLRNYLSQEALLARPDMVKARINLAAVLCMNERFSDAKDLIHMVLEDDANNESAHGL